MTGPSRLDRGRDAYARRDWAEAYEQLRAAAQAGPLAVDDLERLAVVAQLTGHDDECARTWLRAHRECVRADLPARAARCAFWLALALLLRGEVAQSRGWLVRARRLLDDGAIDCAERGYLLVPFAVASLEDGDVDAALAGFAEAMAIGDRFGDPDLATLGRLGRGQALIARGDRAAATELLDDAIVAVTTGELSPLVVGIVYCAAIDACDGMFDVRRAREWTAALTRWCDEQPGLVPFRGKCRVHRAALMQLQGDWRDATVEAQRACEQLAGTPAIGAAHYQQGELHRVRGRLDDAEAAYRRANEWGHEPHPGLALVWLARGQHEAAVAAMRRKVDETTAPMARAQLLAPYVEVLLASGAVEPARVAADELTAIAIAADAPLMLRALSERATASVLLAEGDAASALPMLRRSWRAWQSLDAPYEGARVRMLIARACRLLGDRDSAEMELDAARLVFRQLGAAADVAQLDVPTDDEPADRLGLSRREREVLALVAEGRSNRDIATTLIISEHTVARHVQNIFSKLGVTSRTAASAVAHSHGLTSPE
ncbi:MAG TPA: LuxR C-terminal-related transcriptional regulator [Acidimicrobiales bacterium]